MTSIWWIVRGGTFGQPRTLRWDYKRKFLTPRKKTCVRLLPELLNALLESQGGWDVLGCKYSGYLNKRLPRLSVMR